MDASAESSIRVLIADDHPLMRQGIRMALAAEKNMEVVGEAADGEEALQCILDPDVVILDLDMPKRDGFSVVRELNRLQNKVGIIILTLHTGEDLIHEAMELGIRGYIIKSSAAIEVAEAVRRVAGGGSYFSDAAQKAMQASKYAGTLPSTFHPLSPIEKMLVRKIADGQTSREIAASLDLSGRTIENYRTAICSKLNLKGPNALLRYALSLRNVLR